jgi:hypothetical protein
MGIFDIETGSNVETVTIDGQALHVKRLSALERDTFEQQWLDFKPSDSVIGIRPFYVTWCLCDESGNHEFEPGKGKAAKPEFLEAVDKVSGLPAKIVNPVFDVASRVNALTNNDVGELEKN